jgi:hypothetical protein
MNGQLPTDAQREFRKTRLGGRMGMSVNEYLQFPTGTQLAGLVMKKTQSVAVARLKYHSLRSAFPSRVAACKHERNTYDAEFCHLALLRSEKAYI